MEVVIPQVYAAKEEVKWKIYTNSKFGFFIKHPVGGLWQEVEEEEADGITYDAVLFHGVWRWIEVTKQNEPIDKLARKLKDHLNSHDIKIIDETKTKINGQPAITTEYAGDIYTKEVFIGEGSKVYSIRCGGGFSIEKFKEECKNYFDPMINSFKIL